MRTVRDLLASEYLAKLIAAQRSLDKAAEMFGDVFDELGSPNDRDKVREQFFQAIGDCSMSIERLMGTVVFMELFIADYSDQVTPQ